MFFNVLQNPLTSFLLSGVSYGMSFDAVESNRPFPPDVLSVMPLILLLRDAEHRVGFILAYACSVIRVVYLHR